MHPAQHVSAFPACGDETGQERRGSKPRVVGDVAQLLSSPIWLWESLVIRPLWERKTAGSNPAS